MEEKEPDGKKLYCFQCQTVLRENKKKVACRLKGHYLGQYGHVRITKDHKHDFEVALKKKEIDMGPVNPRGYLRELKPSLPDLPYCLRIPASDIAYLNEVYSFQEWGMWYPDLCTYRDNGADKWKMIHAVSVKVVNCPSSP